MTVACSISSLPCFMFLHHQVSPRCYCRRQARNRLSKVGLGDCGCRNQSSETSHKWLLYFLRCYGSIAVASWIFFLVLLELLFYCDSVLVLYLIYFF